MGAYLSSINNLTNRIEATRKNIRQFGDDIIRDNCNYGWNRDDPKFCHKIHLIHEKPLTKIGANLLQNPNYRLGFQAPLTTLKRPSKEICDEIRNYYTTKVDLVDDIYYAIAQSCLSREEIIASNIQRMLIGAPQTVINEVSQRLDRLLTIILRWYQQLGQKLRQLKEEISIDQLDQLYDSTQELIDSGLQSCCIAVDALRDFYWETLADNQGRIYYYNPYLDQSVYQLPRIRVLSAIRKETSCPNFIGRPIRERKLLDCKTFLGPESERGY